jgi:hypothetical protein
MPLANGMDHQSHDWALEGAIAREVFHALTGR